MRLDRWEGARSGGKLYRVSIKSLDFIPSEL